MDLNNKKGAFNIKAMLLNNAIFVILLLLLVVIIIKEPSFVSLTNFVNIFTQASTRMIFAVGVGGLIVMQGTDLSVGRSVGLAAVVSASLLQAPDNPSRMYPHLPLLPVILPILLVMLLCGFFSFLNGFVVAKLNVTPFIATLGMMLIIYGINSTYFDRPPFGAQPIGGLDKRFTDLASGGIRLFGKDAPPENVSLANSEPGEEEGGNAMLDFDVEYQAPDYSGVASLTTEEQQQASENIKDQTFAVAEQKPQKVGGIFIPYLVIFAALITFIMWVLWNKTKLGKNIFAIGGNPDAAAVSGVNIPVTIMIAYLIAGMLYGFGGALEAARVGSATNNLGNMYEMDAIAACVVGGVSFAGGVGSIGGIVFGVLIFQVINYGMAFIGITPYMQFIMKGLIIIAAVAIDSRKYLKKI